jgi:hypothetical protein
MMKASPSNINTENKSNSATPSASSTPPKLEEPEDDDEEEEDEDIEGDGEFILTKESFTKLLSTYEPFLTYNQCNNDHINISNKIHDAIFVDKDDEDDEHASTSNNNKAIALAKKGKANTRRSSFGVFSSKLSIKSTNEDSSDIPSVSTPHKLAPNISSSSKKLSRKSSRRRSAALSGGGGDGDGVDLLEDDADLNMQDDFATFAYIQSIFKMIDVDGDGFIDQIDLCTWRRMLPVGYKK